MPGPLAAAFKNFYVIITAVVWTESTQMRSFLNACANFRRFFKDFSKLALPFSDHLQRSMELDLTDPTTEALDAFITLKSKS